ncbi:Tripartite-type tricarboxylate transporter, receptor component TctC [Noviherbaspirillum humi]|uniref:Tripartite-type tricarboxylate transporter, receptor component TctC n=1 Tax=Noviherbaspirillum humi TaxID=1688639 RepID=A0A239EYW9_9BURK|nr:tripartite tricarboxylate transporter substrate binding protein [Noviherbaspirillum humi]SNS49034.1 Tripartite-type tricarboxylate transporter, receptor component TctC [Noviherbaspirillum humi]
MNHLHRVLGACAIGAAAFVSTLPAMAAPAALPKTITLVVPFGPGASNDTFARVLAQKLAPKIGSTVIVDNKPGAGGVIGASFVNRAAPDGSVLMLTSSTFTTTAAVQKNLPYDAIKGFAPVSLLATGPMLITVGAQSPYRTAADLIADARANKGKINYASAGIGSINQMSAEMINAMAKTDMTHVPYKGAAAGLTDMISGQVQMMVASPASALGQLKAGKVRVLAVTSPKPSALVPGVPPLANTVPGYEVEIWWGVFAPAGTPPAIVERLNAEINTVINTPEMRERFAQEGAEPTSSVAPDQFAAYVRKEIEKWRTVAQEKHITAE